MRLLILPFDKCLLSIDYIPRTVLGPGDIDMNTLQSLVCRAHILGERQMRNYLKVVCYMTIIYE